MKDINFLITITRRSDEKEYIGFFRKYQIPIVYSTACRGTAKSDTLSILGIEQTEKSVHFLIATEDTTRYLMKKMRTELFIDAPDRGISIAVPISSFGGSSALEFYTQGMNITDKEDDNMPANYELIVAITHKGFSDTVMDAARLAGAEGGTVINAKGTGSENVQKFFGVTIAEEREMVFIVTSAALKKEIIKSIMQKSGIDTPAHTLVFSMPVNDAAGFNNIEADS